MYYTWTCTIHGLVFPNISHISNTYLDSVLTPKNKDNHLIVLIILSLSFPMLYFHFFPVLLFPDTISNPAYEVAGFSRKSICFHLQFFKKTIFKLCLKIIKFGFALPFKLSEGWAEFLGLLGRTGQKGLK